MDFKQLLILHTDGSRIGLGVVLYQIIDGKEHVIVYRSRSLNKGESHYPVHKLIFLALKSAVMMVFHEYLFGNKFTVKSNKNPLTYVLTMAQLDAMGYHWVAQLASYDFIVFYKSGKTNIETDALSRINWDWELTTQVVRMILNTTLAGCSPLAKICAHNTMVLPSFLAASGITQLETEKAMPKQMTAADWTEAQIQDWDLNQIICLYKARQLNMAKLCNFESRESKALLHK